MSRRAWLKRAAAWALLACLGWLAAACGLKGPPRPPKEPVIPGL